MRTLDHAMIYEIVEEVTGVYDTDGDDVVYDLLNEAVAHMTQYEATAWIERFLRERDYMQLWTFYFGDTDDEQYWEDDSNE